MSVSPVSSSGDFTGTLVVELPKFNPQDLGSIVGPSKSACEKNERLNRVPSLRNSVTKPSWNSFNLFKKKTEQEIKDLKKKGEDENGEKIKELSEKIKDNPKNPYIRLSVSEEGIVSANIECDSEVMMKFVKFHLLKYQDSFVPRKKKNVHFLYLILSHDSVGSLIGTDGRAVKEIHANAVQNMDEDTSPEELMKCEKSIVKISEFKPRDFEDFNKMVEESDKHEYVGWSPDENDELVNVLVTNFAGEEEFEDFVACLGDSLGERVNEIKKRNQDFASSRESEIQDMEEALNAGL